MPNATLSEVLLWQLRDFLPSAIAAIWMFCFLLWIDFKICKRRNVAYVEPPELKANWRFWLTSPTFRALSRAAVLATLVGVGWLFGADVLPVWLHGYGPLARQPYWLMTIELVLLADFASYWTHRLMHTVPALWRVHAVHHSSGSVHWHTTVRMHPLNDMITYVGNIVPALAIGFPVEALAPFLPVIAVYAIYSHSNLSFSHGALATVFTSPRFHRWHHTGIEEGGNKNFSGVFSLWDRLFGTYYMPADALPVKFGTDTPDMPEDFWKQLAYPFRSS